MHHTVITYTLPCHRAGHLLRTVVPIIVDVHSSSDPTYDQRNPSSNQVEPIKQRSLI